MYEDIINLKRPKSKHPKMSLYDRSAQFSPFAALTGYEDSISEEARIVDKKKILTSEEKSIINNKLNIINDNIKDELIITIEYFIKDEKKNGGKYTFKKGIVKRIDETEKVIIFDDKTKIKLEDIINIKGDIIDAYGI
ncbi:MAG: hypothetical protein K5892_03095 [Acholeplasmatales bacterium]|nr:hypothetical protein [Acholeplasmatales bacterium]